MKIGIVGGGASGLVAAIAAKRNNNEVYIFERGKRVGRKILATGNGRCNITNSMAGILNYHGNDTEFMEPTIEKFWVNETIDFFYNLGIIIKEESKGKMYPYSDCASAVVDVLRKKCDALGVNIICDFDVKTIAKNGNQFIAKAYSGQFQTCDKVIVATGGKAAPNLGSNGSGYDLLKSFGHKITIVSPSLVQITTDTDFVKKLKGIKIKATLKLKDRLEYGEILFTEYGISGLPVFNASSILTDVTNIRDLEIDFMPDYNYNDVFSLLRQRKTLLADIALEDFLVGIFHKRLGQALIKKIGVASLSRKALSLTNDEIRLLSSVIKGLKLNITGTLSWNNAQVTHGGAMTNQFNTDTMESKLIKGLYACGEILDIDGDCGGYNLQWAWSSGYIAGASAAERRI